MSSVAELFERAVQAHQGGDLETAEAKYRTILATNPNHAPTLTNLGVLLARHGQLEEAVRMYVAAVTADPTLPDAHFNLGNLYRRLGRPTDAAACFKQVLRLNPNHVWAHLNFGLAVSDAGHWSVAVEHFRRAVELNPDAPEAFQLLWDALTRLGRLDEAAVAIRQFVHHAPNDARGHLNLGLTLTALQRLDEAIEELEQALRLRPDYPEAHNALGIALDAAGRADDAQHHYREAIHLRPDYADAWSNLGLSLSDQGRGQEAADTLKHALDVHPDPVIASNRLLSLLALSSIGPDRLAAEHRAWATQYADPLAPPAGSVRYPSPGARLRIGYVFGELRTRSAVAFLEILLTQHDRNSFHITAYPNQLGQTEDLTRLQRLADAWKPLVGLSDAAAAAQIQQDEIDLLIDLSGHTAGHRLLLFAHQPARVQLTMFGYPATTGLKAIRWRISDPIADPPGTDPFGPEAVLHLPTTSRLYVPPASAPPPHPLPTSRQGTFMFACLNHPGKLSEACLDTWAAILKAVPRSRLLLQAGRSAEAVRHLSERFSRAGVSSERLELVHRMPEPDYLEAYRAVDLALDPFPFNGRATTCDALWMGVPVLSLAGNDTRSRQGQSILTNLGLPDFVASSPAQLVALAATWADQRDALADLRDSLRAMLRASALTDAATYIRHLEAAYRTACAAS